MWSIRHTRRSAAHALRAMLRSDCHGSVGCGRTHVLKGMGITGEKKCIRRGMKCQGTTLVVPQGHKMGVGFSP